MPLYEYRCKSCHRKVTILVRSSQSSIACPHCKGTELERLFSSFRIAKTDSAVYDDILSDNQLVKGLMRDDPRALADWNKKMTQGTDQEISPEYDEMLERMEAGEVPDLKSGKKKEEEPAEE